MEFSVLSIVIVVIAVTELSDACNKDHHHKYDLGWGVPVIIIPQHKPSFLDKLKHAFYKGKHHVDVHKIIAPGLKHLPFKKGLGFIGKGWLPLSHLHLHHHGHHAHGHFGHHDHGHFGHHGHYGYPFHFGKGFKGGIGYGKGVAWAPVGPIGHLPHGHGFHGGHHTVSHNTVTTVVEKPHIVPPIVPPVPHAFGHH